MRALACALAVLAPLAAAAQSPAEQSRARVERAVVTYAEALDTGPRELRAERFRQAERLFLSAIEAGIENPDLYTNQGNAALQSGRLGAAVLAYRRALGLDPDPIWTRIDDLASQRV